MKIKTDNLVGDALDWAVELARGTHWSSNDYFCYKNPDYFDKNPEWRYSREWSIAGPLLSEAKISRTIDDSGLWIAYFAYNYGDEKQHMACNRDELTAGLKCYVKLRLGNEIDIPKELL